MIRKFGRTRDQRKALLKGLAASLIMKGKMKTTATRAKEARSLVFGIWFLVFDLILDFKFEISNLRSGIPESEILNIRIENF